MVLPETVAAWRKQVIDAYEAYDDFDREVWEERRVQKVTHLNEDEVLVRHTGTTAYGGAYEQHILRKSDVPPEVFNFIMEDGNYKGDRVTFYTRLLSILWAEDKAMDRRMILTKQVDKEGKPILVDEDGMVVTDDDGKPLVLDDEGKLVPRED